MAGAVIAAGRRHAPAIGGIPQLIGAGARERRGIARAMSIAFHDVPVDRGEARTVQIAGLSVETGVADARAVVAFPVSTAADQNSVLFDLARTAERAVQPGEARLALAVVGVHVVVADALAVAAAFDHSVIFVNQARTRFAAILAVVARVANALRRSIERARSVTAADDNVIIFVAVGFWANLAAVRTEGVGIAFARILAVR